MCHTLTIRLLQWVRQHSFITVYDHPRKEGISPARTSRVISHDPITGNFETRNTMYKLLDTGE